MAPPDVTPLTIPQDIIFTILDYCRDDVLTLKSCALVSHAWVPIAQRYLFSRTRVNVYEYDLSLFISLLRQSPAFRYYIRTLDITCGEITLPDIWELVDRLPNLRSLELIGSCILSESYGDPYVPLSSSGHLESLSFRSCRVLGEEQWRIVFDIVNRFSSIEKLHFVRFTLLEPVPGDPLQVPSPHQTLPRLVNPPPKKTIVGKLHFHPNLSDTVQNLEFISILPERIAMNQVQSMKILQRNFFTNEQMETLIDRALSLKHLSVRLWPYDPRDKPAPKPISLSTIHDLEIISFTIPLYQERSYIFEYLQVGCSLLLSATSSLHSPLSEFRLEIITLAKDVTRTVQSVDWPQIGRSLDRFKILKVVQVKIAAIIFEGHRRLPSSWSLSPDQRLVDTINKGFTNLAHRCVVEVEMS